MAAYSHQAIGDRMALIMDNLIQRFMSEHEWYGTWDEGFTGSGWDGTFPGKSAGSGRAVIRYNMMSQTRTAPMPPSAHYIGDEMVGHMTFQKFEVDPAEVYAPWVERINDAFLGWRSLPDPADFEPVIDHLEKAVDHLTPQEQDAGAFTFVDVEVSNAIEMMRKWVSPQGENSSALLSAFDRAYGVGRITGVMVNQAQVAAGLGFTVAGERELWTKARADIMRIADDSVSAADVRQNGGGTIDPGVVKAFIDLASVFVPKQYGVLLSAASKGIGLLQAVKPQTTRESREVTVSGDTASAVLSSMEQAIRDLRSSIYEEESELQDRLLALRSALRSRSRDDFHLHAGRGHDETFDERSGIRFNSTTVQDVGTKDVPVVAAAFLRSAEEAAAQTGSGIWSRDNFIGYGSNGPHALWQQLIGEFDQITAGSARELVEAGKILAVAAGWVENADVESSLQSQGLDDELERGRLDWQPHEDPQPPPRRPGANIPI